MGLGQPYCSCCGRWEGKGAEQTDQNHAGAKPRGEDGRKQMELEVLQDLVWIKCCISALYKCVAEDGLFALFVNVNSSQGQRYIERYLIYHIKVFFCSTMACVLETNPAGHCLPPAHSSQEPGQEAALMPISSFYICSPKTVMGSCHAKRQLRLFCLQARASPCLKLSVCHSVHSVRHCSSI